MYAAVFVQYSPRTNTSMAQATVLFADRQRPSPHSYLSLIFHHVAEGLRQSTQSACLVPRNKKEVLKYSTSFAEQDEICYVQLDMIRKFHCPKRDAYRLCSKQRVGTL
jgi:hypothetical protein